MPDAVGRDLLAGLETLYAIQEVIGGSEEMSQEKKALEAFKGDEFMELKYRMMKKIEIASAGVKEFNEMDAASCAPDVKIKKQHELREVFKGLTAQWQELDKIHNKEASKKKSKLGQQELLNRGEMRDNLKEHVDGLKQEFISAYSGTSGGAEEAVKLPTFQSFKQEMGERRRRTRRIEEDARTHTRFCLRIFKHGNPFQTHTHPHKSFATRRRNSCFPLYGQWRGAKKSDAAPFHIF